MANMDEKGIIGRHHYTTHRRFRQGLYYLLVLAIVLCYLTYKKKTPTIWQLDNCLHQTSNSTTYPGEDGLVWEACGEINGRNLECTRLDVPMDQFNKTNSGDKVFNLPVIRMRGDKDAKNILLNPGGPGGSGVGFVIARGDDLSAILGTGFHIVGFDPRGVNGSVPQAVCYPSREDRRALIRPDTYHPQRDSAEAYAWSKSFVQSCVDSMDEHGKYINTPNTAADLNTIMDKLGQKEMYYWGSSYGTILGQTYATLFPERSNRIAIDGVASNTAWYDDLMFNDTSLQDADKVLYGFFEECIKAGDDCPLSPFAETAKDLQQKILDLANSFEDQPLSVYVNNTHWGSLKSENIIHTALFSSIYKPARWWSLADKLAALLKGNVTEAFLAWGGHGPFDNLLSTDESNTIIHANDAIAGLEHWPSDRQEVLDRLGPLLNSSIFSSTWANGVYTRQLWKIPKTHNFKQKKSVKTVHPLLVLSTTYDPVCPLSDAKGAVATFEGSRLVEVEAYGHCSTAMPSKCAARHIRAFFYNGTLPEEDVKCGIDGPYFINPEKKKPDARTSYKDEALYRAQLRIAQDEKWPYIAGRGR